MELELLVGMLIVLVASVLGTSGTAALMTVWFPSWRGSIRVFIATITLPILLIGPIVMWAFMGEGSNGVSSFDDGIGTLAVMAILGFIGWPVAHFLTRALDRQRMSISDTFE